MTSRKSFIRQRFKDLVSEPKPEEVVHLMRAVAARRHRVPAHHKAVPSVLVEALRSPAPGLQVVALTVDDHTLVVAVLPTGQTDPDRESTIWNWTIGRIPQWSEMQCRVTKMHRERLLPEIAGVLLADAGQEPVIDVNSDLPHITAIATIRALRTHIAAGAAAAIMGVARWVYRGAQRHSLPLAAAAGAASAAAVVAPVVSVLQAPQGQGEAYRPPAVIYTVPGPTLYRTRTRIATVTATQHAAAFSRKPPAGTFPPVEAIHGTSGPGPKAAPETTPRPSPRRTRRPRRHASTPSPEPVSSPSPTPISSMPGAMPGSEVSAAEDSPAADSVPSAEPVEASTAPVATSGPASPPDQCSGLVDVGATVGPIGLDVCVG